MMIGIAAMTAVKWFIGAIARKRPFFLAGPSLVS